ncbi:HD domain-containing protein [Agrobacterium larrymoorei]|uniref:ATP-binding protein n=1 Tax=Agrobacterium larrymoorei TaxID=160699 RepID=A0AAF0KCT7_9HYPH|nr:ATP-binding protein [Agrobacterium larrymoorei]WHA40153.1 ATP-binding protein [Agrobacterium larrymoorei]
MSEYYQATGLWKNSLGSRSTGHSDHMDTLRSAYQDFRRKAFVLTDQIAKALPALTIHDGTHLDALWETADLIAGPSYPINPLEGFVLGGAILLHDAALCFEAYEGGKTKLRNSTEWRDSFAAIQERSPTLETSSAQDEADFAALRLLHASRAKELAETAWISADGNKIFLIENSDLRNRYGPLIGKIAASHHWPIEELSGLGEQFNAPGHFPREWRVDPVKIACLLRCADAAHLDSRRAPDFLMALTRREGISSHHWIAQNWLARADVSQLNDEDDTIVFTSNRDFSKEHTQAWWVAYDAITLVQAEIVASNKLLEARTIIGSPKFAINKVKGTNSPEDMSVYVRASGWEPCSAKIHVGNLQKLVNDLGGKQLYGETDQLGIALRELIQNSRDALAARRIVDQTHNGLINIQLSEDNDGAWSIEVVDTGVGMSERVLTGPLLDFGSSFWVSSLVQDEFPGLRSSAFRSVGRFGIGFYAVFMVAESVTVSSRRWDAALSQIVTLEFQNGLTLRPTRTRGRPENFPTSASTSVKLKLKAENVENGMVLIRRNRIGEQNFLVALEDYVSALVCGLDVGVSFKGPNDDRFKIVHTPVSSLKAKNIAADWLARMSFQKYHPNTVSSDDLLKIVERLRFVDPDHPEYGFAALSTRVDHATTFLSSRTVGGLSTSVHGRGDDQFFGFLDFPARSAKREAEQNPVIPQNLLEAWVNEQLALLEKEGITDIHKLVLTSHLCELKTDPAPVFRALILRGQTLSVLTLSQLLDAVVDTGLAIFKAGFMDHIDTYVQQQPYKHYPVFRPFRNGAFLSLERDASGPTNPNSLLGCLYREAAKRGYEITVNQTGDIVSSVLGNCEVLILTASSRVPDTQS